MTECTCVHKFEVGLRELTKDPEAYLETATSLPPGRSRTYPYIHGMVRKQSRDGTWGKAKPRVVVPTYCPFCGKRYEEELLTAERDAQEDYRLAWVKLERKLALLKAERDALASQLLDVAERWTPVGEQLPDAGVQVLITVGATENGPLATWGVATFDGLYRWWGFRGHHLGKTKDIPVLAWRPLPAPYAPPKEPKP